MMTLLKLIGMKKEYDPWGCQCQILQPDKVSICVKKHVPLVKLSRKQLSLRAKPWITVRIESMMAKRDRYLRKFNRTHSLDMEYLYKKFRNKVVSQVRKSKNEYYAEYFAKHKTNMKMLWSGIRSIINSKLNIGSVSHALLIMVLKLMTPNKWLTY